MNTRIGTRTRPEPLKWDEPFNTHINNINGWLRHITPPQVYGVEYVHAYERNWFTSYKYPVAEDDVFIFEYLLISSSYERKNVEVKMVGNVTTIAVDKVLLTPDEVESKLAYIQELILECERFSESRSKVRQELSNK